MPALSIVFLGTGNAFNVDGRGSQSIWIEPAGGPPFLVDVGPTALAAMQRFGLRPGAVGRVFLPDGPGGAHALSFGVAWLDAPHRQWDRTGGGGFAGVSYRVA